MRKNTDCDIWHANNEIYHEATHSKKASDASLGMRSVHDGAGAKKTLGSAVNQDVNKDGGALCNQLQMETPKYSGIWRQGSLLE